MRSLTLLAVLLLVVPATAADVNVGDKAPGFEAVDDSGETWKSADHIGKKIVVVYFYPADMTGGCTAQACGYRDNMDALKKAGVEVVGVSGDSAENHQLFKKEHDLNFTLLADGDGAVAKKFGVPVSLGEKTVKKLIGGKNAALVRTATAKRWTFVIDLKGNIVHKDAKVKAKQDPEKILEVVKKLKVES
ncbi:MAG: peroxiredoxin [Planctomycetota bacterium]